MRSKWNGIAGLACAACMGVSAAQVTIDHRWSNTDAQGDLWTLDGPAVYRQYWGRGE